MFALRDRRIRYILNSEGSANVRAGMLDSHASGGVLREFWGSAGGVLDTHK